MFSHLTDPISSLLYPQYCGACGQLVERIADGAACRACWASTKVFGENDILCGKCGTFLAESPHEAAGTCGQCDLQHFDLARAAGVYERALSASVLHLKRVPNVARTVSDSLIGAFERLELSKETLVVPVPLSKRRTLERGFNQAELLASAIAMRSGRRTDAHSLVRTKDTPMHRAAMDRKAREATVKNIFSVVRPGLIDGRDVLLVDDLMTSGSTVSQCAKALKKNGAGRVVVLTLARAV